MLINDYSELERNYEILRRYSERCRDEITVFAGVVAEANNLTSYDNIVKFYDSLNDEVFLGNMLEGVMNNDMADIIDEIANGRMTFSEYIINNNLINVEDFEEKLKEYREERA